MAEMDNMMLDAMREDAMRQQLHKSKRMIWVTSVSYTHLTLPTTD